VSAASKNSGAAVDFLKWIYEPVRYAKIMLMKGLTVGALKT
jgi:hypothetical protein